MPLLPGLNLPSATTIWADTPTRRWTEALPTGSGRHGVMTWAEVGSTRLQINDETAWSGHADSAHTSLARFASDEGPQQLAAVRALLDAGDLAGAQEAAKALQGHDVQAFLPFADLTIDFAQEQQHEVQGSDELLRWLDVNSGVVSHRYRIGEVEAHHETYASHPDGVTVHQLQLSGPPDASVTLHLSLTTVLRGECSSEQGMLMQRVRIPSHVIHPSRAADDRVLYSEQSRAGITAVRVLIDGVPAPVQPTENRDAVTVDVDTGSTLSLLVATGTSSSPLSQTAGSTSGSTQPLVGTSDAPAEIEQQVRATLQAAEKLLLTELELEYAASTGNNGASDLLSQRHLQDRHRLMGACTLSLPAGESATLPTADRIAAHEVTPGSDPELAALAFAHGRHLLVSSSRPGGLPANLQGIWADHQIPAPWNSNYTVNINLQMNYWPAESTGLAECHEPLMGLLHRLSTNGTEVARTLYGMPGWTAHHNSDAWAHAYPALGSPSWANWPMGGIWLTRHILTHLLYLPEEQKPAIAHQMWPVIRGAVDFARAWIRPPAGDRHYADTAPATSPENLFLDGEETLAVTTFTRMDGELLNGLVDTAQQVLPLATAHHQDTIHADDAAAVEDLARLVDQLPPIETGPHGEILEWDTYREEQHVQHRHLSHLVGLYPLGLWDTESHPERAQAARTTLQRRGPESTGWSMGWQLGLWARLREAQLAEAQLFRALRPATTADGKERSGMYANLFSAHPPYQIDGNLGLVAGVVEMLLDARDGTLRLLPALPASWPEGEVRGLRGPHGVVVDITWKDHQLQQVVIAGFAGELAVRYANRSTVMNSADKGRVTLGADLTPAEFGI